MELRTELNKLEEPVLLISGTRSHSFLVVPTSECKQLTPYPASFQTKRFNHTVKQLIIEISLI